MENQYNLKDIQLQGRNTQSRKMANNTYLERRDANIVLKLHDTDIITYQPNGDIILNSGGWHTVTTKDRISSGLPHGYTLTQSKSIWYIIKHLEGKEFWNAENPQYRFKDGITIKWSGKVINSDNVKSEAKDVKIKAKIKEYAKLCASKIPLDPPSGGDCWYCLMQTEEGKSLGDAIKDTEHLLSHIKERYIVSSLVYNALKEKYNAEMAFWQTFKNSGYPEGSDREFGKHAVYKAVYRYIASRLGYAV